jgi:putative salt-induced outer membrane protein
LKKIILSALVASSLMMAEEVVDKNQLITHSELGFIQTSGNTDTKTFNLEVDAKKAWDEHKFTFDFDAQYAEDQGVESKNKFSTELGYGCSLTERLSATYLVGYKQDKFSGFDYQAYTGPGLKYLAITGSVHKLDVEGSILYSKDQVEDTKLDATGAVILYPNPDNIAAVSVVNGSSNSYASYRAKAVYAWQMLANLKFDQELSYRAEIKDADVYFVYSKTSFSSKISDILSAGISYKVDYVNTPPQGKENTDKTFTANLIIDY